MTPHDMPYRALLRHENGDPSPPVFGNIASEGILTSSIKTEPVTDARKANLCFMGGADIPGVP